MTWTAQAEQLAAEVAELAGDTAMVNAAAWLARVDPAATDGLCGAAIALGARPESLLRSSCRALPHDREMLARTADLEASAAVMLKRAGDLHKRICAALDAACEAAAAAAQALREDGPRGPTREALARAQAPIADCECALELLAGLGKRLSYALGCFQRVPDDLASTYEVPYVHVRRGGTLPYDGDFLTGVPACRP